MRSLSTRAAGLLILVLGVWGALVPFVGPYFHFTLGPTHSWTWTSGRLWLSVLPGIAAVIGGLMLLGSGPRPAGKIGALLALAAGAWFAIGPDVSLLWKASGAQGVAHGSVGIRVLEMITYHTGLGVVIAALAGYALPGFLTRRAAVAEAGAGAGAAVGTGAGAAAGTGAGAAALAGRETAVRPARRGVEEPAVAGEPAAVDREPAVAGETGAVDREPAGVGATAAGRRAEYAGAPGRGTYGDGTAVAEREGEYGTDGAAATAEPATAEPTTEGPATAGPASTSAPPADVRRRRRRGLLSAFRR